MEIELIKFDIHSAEWALKPESNPFNDERFINISVYHTQQAIEKILKFYLEKD